MITHLWPSITCILHKAPALERALAFSCCRPHSVTFRYYSSTITFFLAGSFQAGSGKQATSSSLDSSSSADCTGGRCSAPTAQGRGFVDKCNNPACNGCGTCNGSSMSVFQASTARKKTTAGLGIETFLTFTLFPVLFMYVCMYLLIQLVTYMFSASSLKSLLILAYWLTLSSVVQ